MNMKETIERVIMDYYKNARKLLESGKLHPNDARFWEGKASAYLELRGSIRYNWKKWERRSKT